MPIRYTLAAVCADASRDGTRMPAATANRTCNRSRRSITESTCPRGSPAIGTYLECTLNSLGPAIPHRLRNLDAKCRGGLQVDYQLELGWLFDGHIGRLGSLEDLVDVSCSASPEVDETRPIRQQTARFDEKPLVVKARELALGGEIPYELSVLEVNRITEREHRIDAALCHGREGRGVIVRGAHLDRLDNDPGDRRRGQRFSETIWLNRARGIPHHGHTRDLRSDLLEELKTLSHEIGRDVAEARHIATRMGEALHEAHLVGIRRESHHNRNRAGRVLRSADRLRPRRDDDVDI